VTATTKAWASIAPGDAVSPLELEMTATRIVAGAIASRDFMPVHHDQAYANSQGAPDIFMNILSTTAYCSRFLTDWAGPDTMVKRLAIRLGVPVHPGSTLTFTGTVTATAKGIDDGLIDIEFRATNDLGDHVTGTATLSLPLSS
jgi:acyl dehydratase